MLDQASVPPSSAAVDRQQPAPVATSVSGGSPLSKEAQDDLSQILTRMAPVYERVKSFISEPEWLILAPVMDEINHLKKQRNAVILAHNYQTPDIFHGISDIVGDSLALARDAVTTDADVILVCGVHFMAETAKILNPDKTVLIPDSKAGCSLADSITAADVRKLRADNPGVPIVTYVNTSADVKAESDICCTSGNAKQVVEGLGVDKVLMIPDQYLAANIAKQTDVEILTWAGACEVHEQFSPQDIHDLREAHEDLTIIAHPECPPEVVDEADFSGSTAGMIDFVRQGKSKKVALITECSMSDNVAAIFPEVDFVRPCNLCPHMKLITLEKIRDALKYNKDEIMLDPDLGIKAKRSVERMLAVKV